MHILPLDCKFPAHKNDRRHYLVYPASSRCQHALVHLKTPVIVCGIDPRFCTVGLPRRRIGFAADSVQAGLRAADG